MKKLLILIHFLVFSLLVKAQYEDYGFQRDLSIIVKDSLHNIMKNPWGGGMNSCQFSQIDLNGDGIPDLFIYDRNSSRILTFINNGTPDSVDYVYAPQYEGLFPPIQTNTWARCYDYNNDGKADFFTYNYGGIQAWENVTPPSGTLKFRLIANQILSVQDGNYTSVNVANCDWPAFVDLDGDGDMDILTYFNLVGPGCWLEYHKNMSKELYHNADSLTFVQQTYCWGSFCESLSGDHITLDTACPYSLTSVNPKNVNNIGNGVKHLGNTVLAAHFNGDSLYDLLMGDNGFPNLIELTNGGTPDSAFMISQDTMFPNYSVPLHLYSLPAPFLFDVNNDGIKDLIVSPNDPSQTNSEDLKSCWYYKNVGTNSKPIFQYQCNNFLQKDMIDIGSSSYPVLFDYNGDGLPDLFIGNFGAYDSSYYDWYMLNSTHRSKIALYQNVGTKNNPQFQFVTNDFANIYSRNISGVLPTFGDLYGNGHPVMIIGRTDGYLDLYTDTAASIYPLKMVLTDTEYMNIHVGYPADEPGPSSAPQLIDINGDSLLDLVIGQENGNLSYYQNIGTKTSPYFKLINDSLGGVNVTQHATSNYGYSIPCFFRDSTGKLRLFVGSQSGNLYYYKDIENNLLPGQKFTLVDSNYLYIYEGQYSSFAVGNLTNATYPDLIVGNYSGGLSFLKGVTPSLLGMDDYTPSYMDADIYPNPAYDKINISFPKNVSLETANISIYNSQGLCVLAMMQNTPATITIDVSSLTDGLYICTITGKDKQQGKELSLRNKFLVIH
jgi:hypothetical protein